MLEFVLVTEKSLFKRFRMTPAFVRLANLCDVKLMPIDDLLIGRGSYGVTLTCAYHRGFSDLGDRMRDYFLFFLNADFVLADRSYETALENIRKGATLLLAPSYCVTTERVVPLLQEKYLINEAVLEISKREMSEIILKERHKSIQGKTVNQNVMHMEFVDQFYWDVDESSMLARQLPIAVVGLRPERTYVNPVTFWDYGMLSEMCPKAVPCVLGDSDQFAMMELRKDSSVDASLKAGWPSQREIAQALSKFTTEDQRKLGRYTLVVHSKKLPDNFSEHVQKFSEYVDGVYKYLGIAHSHVNHSQWIYHSSVLQRHQILYRLRYQVLEGWKSKGIGRDVQGFSGNISIYENCNFKGGRGFFVKNWERISLLAMEFINIKYLFILFRDMPRIIKETNKGINTISLFVSADFNTALPFLRAIPGYQTYMSVDFASNVTLSPVAIEVKGRPIIESDSFPKDRRDSFGLCIIFLAGDDVIKISKIFDNVIGVMRPGSKILAICSDLPSEYQGRKKGYFLPNLTSSSDARVMFMGSRYLALAIRLLNRGFAKRGEYGGVPGNIYFAPHFLAALVAAVYAKWRDRTGPLDHVPEGCTGFALEIDVK